MGAGLWLSGASAKQLVSGAVGMAWFSCVMDAALLLAGKLALDAGCIRAVVGCGQVRWHSGWCLVLLACSWSLF
jgi:hypothetical protein